MSKISRAVRLDDDDDGDFALVSQHDSGSECTPGESKSQDKKERGNYIMYARATSGDKLNNNKFSVCSIKNISQVLEKKRGSCFVGETLGTTDRSSLRGLTGADVCVSVCAGQSPGSRSAGTGWWSRARSVTADTAISVKTSAATTPINRTTGNANSNPTKSAGKNTWPQC